MRAHIKKIYSTTYGSVLFSLFIIGFIFGTGYYVGKSDVPFDQSLSAVSNKELGKPESVDFALFWKAWKTLNEKYVPTKNKDKIITDKDKLYGSIAGLASSLGDPYTVFFPPEEAKAFESEISGNFEGLGIEVGMKENILTVISPLKGTPAYKAGILAGDKIVEIDGVTTQNLSIDQSIKKMRGKKGTSVELTIARASSKTPLKIKVVRDVIDIPTIDNELKDNGVYVIRLYSFSEQSPRLFRDALQGFVDSGSSKLVFDLRGNPGGYLEAAVDMASWFLPEGKVVVTEDFGKSQESIVYRSKGYNVFSDKLKMVVLVDGGSASASEILAGALKAHKIATVVGTPTFGKGSVQELVKLTNDTSLKVTVARWLTPENLSISEGGLKPDVEVKITEKEALEGKDPALEKAYEILLKK